MLLPTRGRHHRLGKFIDSILRTANNPIEFVFYVDQDDQPTQDVLAELKRILFDGIKWHVGLKPIKLSDTYNVLYPLASANIICYAADDLIFHNRGWDQIVESEFAAVPDQILLLYPASQPDIPLHGFVSRISCEVLGYFFPPYFEHGYADRWLLDIYNIANRSKHCPALEVEHDHWHSNKDLYDQVYFERSEKLDEQGRNCDDRDLIIYDEKQNERKADGNKLLAYIESQSAGQKR